MGTTTRTPLRGGARLIARTAIASGARPRATYVTFRYPLMTKAAGYSRPLTRSVLKVCAVASMTWGLKFA